jgi:hypothetical protein
MARFENPIKSFLTVHKGVQRQNQTAFRPMVQNVEMIVDRLFSLGEPWSERFLLFTAKNATGKQWDAHVPDRREVLVWLQNDQRLRTFIDELLRAWLG